ncbi:HNH endonuclease signature motif containing protein [Kribbella antiqua]|nr:HNH endonuclease signature motif containing protein [Kribbella antiqua]
MELLGARPVSSMSGGEMLTTLDAVDGALAWLETFRLQLIGGLEDVGHAAEIGAHDTARLLEFRYRLNSADARRSVRLACALPKYHAVDEALAAHEDSVVGDDTDLDVDGDDVMTRSTGWVLRPAQAEAIVSTLERHAKRIAVEDRDVIEQQLVALAAHLTPDELRTSAKELCNLVDSDGPEPDENTAYDRESLRLSTAENGVKFNGYLANENAELFRAWITTGAKPHKTVTGDLDPRLREKRQADALSTALSIAAAATDTGFPTRPGATTPTGTTAPDNASTEPVSDASTSADAGSSEATLFDDAPTGAKTPAQSDSSASNTTTSVTTTGCRAPRNTTGDPAAAGGRGSGWVPGFGAKANITVTIDFNDLKAATANATGQLVYGDNLSAAAIRRLACDANIIPLVLGSNSEPLDVGRSERLVNRAIRRALNARDKGCVVCGAPPIYCDAHHIIHWIDGGPTAVSNMVLLCRRHHIDLHHGHWTIQIIDGAVHVTRPTWADPTPRHKLRLGSYRRRLPTHARQNNPAFEPETVQPSPPAQTPRTGATATSTASIHEAAARSIREAVELSLGKAVRVDPWGEAQNPGEDKQPLRNAEDPRSRWRADGEALQEAARFAVWGDTSTTGAPA